MLISLNPQIPSNYNVNTLHFSFSINSFCSLHISRNHKERSVHTQTRRNFSGYQILSLVLHPNKWLLMNGGKTQTITLPLINF